MATPKCPSLPPHLELGHIALVYCKTIMMSKHQKRKRKRKKNDVEFIRLDIYEPLISLC
jgi:hypothetical protein